MSSMRSAQRGRAAQLDHAEARLIAAHLARAISKHEAECRRDGVLLPPALPLLVDFLVSLASARQDATPLADLANADHSGPMERTLLTKRETAAELRCSVRTVERMISAGRLAAVELGGQLRVRRVDLDAFVESLAPRSFREAIESKEA